MRPRRAARSGVHAQSTKRNRRGGACVPARTSAQRRFHTKNTCIVRGVFNDGCALAGRHGRRHTGTAPTNLHQTTRCAITSSHCTFDSPRQPRGVPLPHRGYTFDSAGLASVTQPTLGNNASEGATPLGVVLFPPHCFLMSSPSHTHRGRKCIAHSPPITQNKKVCVSL